MQNVRGLIKIVMKIVNLVQRNTLWADFLKKLTNQVQFKFLTYFVISVLQVLQCSDFCALKFFVGQKPNPLENESQTSQNETN
jgi:hypothetical protein